MRHNGDWCNGPPYCNVHPFAWGSQPDGYTYPDQLGPGGQAHPRYAQTMCDDEGWCKQLGQATADGNSRWIMRYGLTIAGAALGAYYFGSMPKRRGSWSAGNPLLGAIAGAGVAGVIAYIAE